MCVSGEERAFACKVGNVCVRMRGCGVGSNRGDSPAGSPGPATRDPPREENRTLLAVGMVAATNYKTA